MYDLELKFTSHETKSRRLWQVLFDLYRSNGCSLHNMLDILVDYEYAKRVFEKLRTDDRVFVVWGCDRDSHMTTWFEVPSGEFNEVLNTINNCPTSFHVLCEITLDGVKFTALQEEQAPPSQPTLLSLLSLCTNTKTSQR